MSNLGFSRKEVINVISYITQANYFVQADSHSDYLIWEEQLPNLNSRGQVTKAQAMTTEQSQICVLQQ